MASRLILVRHGETEWSLSRQHTGNTDIPLTIKGRAAAKALGTALLASSPDHLLSSPLQRARVTAELAVPEAKVEIDDDLREWHYGDYEGITTKKIHETDPLWDLWHSGAPFGETPAQVAQRCDRLLSRIANLDGVVGLFGHGHQLRALAARWLGEDIAFGARLVLDTGSISMLGFEHSKPAILHWNVSAAFADDHFDVE